MSLGAAPGPKASPDGAGDGSLPLAARGSRVLAWFCWVVSAASWLAPYSNPDLFWHLSAARRMFEMGAVPRADWLSYTMSGRPWVDFEWLAELYWYVAFRFLGSWGLLAAKAAPLALAAWCVWKACGLYGLGPGARGLCVLAWTAATASSNDVRADNFSAALFAATWWFLESRRLQGALPAPSWRTRAAVAAAFCLWANLHAAFALALALGAVFAAAEAWRRRSLELAALVACAVAGTFLNPFGHGVYVVALAHGQHLSELSRYILEWTPTSVLAPILAPFWSLVAVCFAAMLAGHLLRPAGLPTEHLASACGLALAAARYSRNAPFFASVGVPVAACHLPAVWPERPSWLRQAALWTAAAALASFVALFEGPSLAMGVPYAPRFVPTGLITFLKAESRTLGPRRMVHPWAWGGYLGYYLYPDYRVFVDGRYLFHPMMPMLSGALSSPEDYRDFLSRQGADVVLWERTSRRMMADLALGEGRSFPVPRPEYLLYLPPSEWALVSWSLEGGVFVRRGAVDPGWVRDHEYAVFRLDDRAAAEVLVQEGKVPPSRLLAEARRFAREEPELARAAGVLEWAARVAARAGSRPR